MIIFLYTLSLILALSRVLNYPLGFFMLTVLVIGALLLERLIFINKKVAFVSVVLTAAGVAFYGFLMYRLDKLGELYGALADFFWPYYYSLIDSATAVDSRQQIVLILLVAWLIAASLHYLLLIKGAPYSLVIALLASVFVAFFLIGQLHGTRAKYSFILFASSAMLHFYWQYYHSHLKAQHRFTPLVPTVALSVCFVMVSALLLYHFQPKPLHIETAARRVRQNSGALATPQQQAEQALEQLRRDSFTLQNSFIHHGIPVMRIIQPSANYIKADTYEIYHAGSWTKSPLSTGRVADTLTSGSALSESRVSPYYVIDDVTIMLSDVTTNMIYSTSYGNIDTSFPALEQIVITYDDTRHTYFASDVLPSHYTYQLTALVPKIGSEALSNLIAQNEGNDIPPIISQYGGAVPPDIAAELESFARAISDDVSGQYQKALAIERYLKNNYRYSETIDAAPPTSDPVLYFLNEQGEGFCQQFASALVLLLRSIDIPARYVKGYYYQNSPIEPNINQLNIEQDDFSTIYDSHAHTWVEAYFPAVGWLVMEATPGRNNLILDDTHRTLNESTEEISRVEPPQDTVKQSERPSTAPWLLLVGSLLLAGAIFLLWRYKRARGTRRPAQQMTAYYNVIQRYYRTLGFTKKANETHREFAARIDRSVQPIYDLTLAQLIAPYEAYVYGEKAVQQADLQHFVNYLTYLKIHSYYSTPRFSYLANRLFEYFAL